jgi:hypothetical protein
MITVDIHTRTSKQTRPIKAEGGFQSATSNCNGLLLRNHDGVTGNKQAVGKQSRMAGTSLLIKEAPAGSRDEA